MIEIQNIHKWFGAQHVLRGVDLTIREGETVVIIGRSGCGKSVLLKHIMAILEPDEGDIKIDGRSMYAMPPEEQDQCRLQLGMLFQGAALFDSLTVRENVGFSLLEHTKLSEEVIDKTVREKLRLVGLAEIEDLMPASLSGGMKKGSVLRARSATSPRSFSMMSRPRGWIPSMRT